MKKIFTLLALLSIHQSIASADDLLLSHQINFYTNSLGGIPSDETFNYFGADYGAYYSYDDFTLANDSYVTKATWTGYFSNGGLPAAEYPDVVADFNIRFANSSAGNPSDTGFTQRAVTATVTPGRLWGTSTLIQIYNFEATFDSPVYLSKDEKYWFSTALGTPFDTSFYWESENNNSYYGTAASYRVDYDEWQSVNYATNFMLYGDLAPIPIPAAVWLFGSALLGFVGMGRRQFLN